MARNKYLPENRFSVSDSANTLKKTRSAGIGRPKQEQRGGRRRLDAGGGRQARVGGVSGRSDQCGWRGGRVFASG